MIKRIILYISLIINVTFVFSQVSENEQTYNSFTSRNFMKFNRFLTIPTFSALREDKASVTAVVRNSFVQFEDAPRLYLASYSGKMRENVGAGLAVYQQQVGVFKDFGALANYAQKLQVSKNTDLTFGFNFMYSRRSADGQKGLYNEEDPSLSNFQDRPVLNFQPAITVSFGQVDVGLFFENLFDFDMKKNEIATSFSDKSYSAHAMYTYTFEDSKGLLEDMDVRVLAIARKGQTGGFGYSGNIILDLPKAGWFKVTYDKEYGISVGAGVNLSKRLSAGFSYEKGDFAATNEVGLTYTFNNKPSYESPANRGTIEVVLPENKPDYKNPEYNNLSHEIEKAQDSLDALNRKINNVLKRLDNKPNVVEKRVEIVKESTAPSTTPSKPVIKTPVDSVAKTPTETVAPKQPENKVAEQKAPEEASKPIEQLERRSDTPWRRKTRIRVGGTGGTMHYVVFDQFKDAANAKKFANNFKRRKINAKTVRDPKTGTYYVYIKKYARKKSADDFSAEINDNTGRRAQEDSSKTNSDDVVAKIQSTSTQPVYVVKITFESKGTYEEPKRQKPARVSVIKKVGNLERGYYIVTNVFSKQSFAERFVDELRNDNIDANYFVNPINGYRYVYIAKTDDRKEAIRLYKSNLDGSYYDEKTIIQVR